MTPVREASMVGRHLRVWVAAALMCLAGGCQSGDSRVRNAPHGPADLCASIGAGLYDRLIPGGEADVRAADFGLSNEATCSVSSPVSAVSEIRGTLFVELHRHGTDASGRTADQICRQDLDGHKLQDASYFADPSASELPLNLGDVTASLVRPVSGAVEAEILLCRSADFVKVSYQASGIDRAAASAGATEVARRVLKVVQR